MPMPMPIGTALVDHALMKEEVELLSSLSSGSSTDESEEDIFSTRVMSAMKMKKKKSLDRDAVTRSIMKNAVQKLYKDSKLFGDHRNHASSMVVEASKHRRRSCAKPPEYDWDDIRRYIRFDAKVGSGGFNAVYKIALPWKKSMVIKRVSTPDDRKYPQAVCDLITEGHFLTVLKHPNLIRLHGIASTTTSRKPFLVLESLDTTLCDKMKNVWRQQYLKNNSVDDVAERGGFRKGAFLHRRRLEARRACWHERLQVAMDIAKVMDYLHKNNVVYRDLKPGNVGFRKNRVKLFDLGLAKEIKVTTTTKTTAMSEKEASCITGKAGTSKYMAPEVVAYEKYGKPVDLYSFGILLWELCTLTEAFKGYSREALEQHVARGNERPPLKAEWPDSLKELLKACWSPVPAQRPSWMNVLWILQMLLESKTVV